MAEHPLAGRSVLVTGGTGFLGTHLLRELVNVRARVHAIRRNASTSCRPPCEGVTWHLADLEDSDSLRQAVRSAAPDVAYHLAAYGTTIEASNVERAYRVNVEGSLQLWNALPETECRLVYVGSCGEYGNVSGQVRESVACKPETFYSATKHAATTLLCTLGRQTGREVVVLRPFGPFGPADTPGRVVPDVIAALLKGEEVRVTAGEQRRDYSFVSDHVEAMILAGTRPLVCTGEIYNIGSGEVILLRDLIEMIAHAVGGDAISRVRFGARPYRENEVWEMCPNIDAARRDLHFQPRVSLQEGLARTVAWYRDHLLSGSRRMTA